MEHGAMESEGGEAHYKFHVYVSIDSERFAFCWCFAEEPREPASTLFDKLEAEDSERSVALPPSNAFEEMIRWTVEGKLWKFPIDNEQGTTTLFCWVSRNSWSGIIVTRDLV